MNEVQETEWEQCCVCDSERKGDLRSIAKGIVTLAWQFVEFLKNGLLPFDPGKITTNYVVEEDATEHPDFEHVILKKSAKFHYNCHIQYSPYKLGKEGKTMTK